MNQQNEQNSDDGPIPNGPSTARLPLILLVAQGQKRALAHELLQRIDRRLQPVNAPSVAEAVAYLTVVWPQMLVLDLALDDDPEHSAVLRLARLSPATVVLAFSEAPTQLPNPARHGWSWDDAESVLETSINNWRRADGKNLPPAVDQRGGPGR